VQHHAAHVGVIVVEHVAHLAVGQRRVEEAELEAAAEHGRLWPAGRLVQDVEQRGDGLAPAPRQRTTDPIEHAAAGRPHRRGREVAESRRRKTCTERLGQRRGVAVEILLHD